MNRLVIINPIIRRFSVKIKKMLEVIFDFVTNIFIGFYAYRINGANICRKHTEFIFITVDVKSISISIV